MRILMLANGFTSTKNMPQMLAERIGAEVVQHARGGARLAAHLNNKTLLSTRTPATLQDEY